MACNGCPDKRIASLPVVRVSERLETSLMRLAAAEDRPLSDYIRRVLERHCFGHAGTVDPAAETRND